MADIREAAIILPRHALAERNLERDLIRYFGGFSRLPISGAWVDDKTGERYDDDSQLYTVAMEVTPANATRLYTLAREAGVTAQQITVYVRQADGRIEFAPTGGQRHDDAPEIVQGQTLEPITNGEIEFRGLVGHDPYYVA